MHLLHWIAHNYYPSMSKLFFVDLYRKRACLQNGMGKKNGNWSLGHYHCPFRFLQLCVLVLMHKTFFFDFWAGLASVISIRSNKKFKFENQTCIFCSLHSYYNQLRFYWTKIWHTFVQKLSGFILYLPDTFCR